MTETGAVTLASFGVDVAALLRGRRKFAGSCLDWTQRRPHLNGALGAAITARLLQLGWIERGRSRRFVRVTQAGQDGLAATSAGRRATDRQLRAGWVDPRRAGYPPATAGGSGGTVPGRMQIVSR